MAVANIGKEDLKLQKGIVSPLYFDRRTTMGGAIRLIKFPDLWEGEGRIVARKVVVTDDDDQVLHSFGAVTLGYGLGEGPLGEGSLGGTTA